ncbi:phage baseplate assembly protein V [Psychrilyobacter sp.]|uniref:phage baseplate assembly protein V n=1 Tax=Psychrilyobacter sp. TaxID=2586924 RepID=UPI003018E7EC
MFRFLRLGKVSSINYKEVSVSVEFDDSPGVISKGLKILSDHTSKEKDYSLPNPGEDVVCVFLPHAPTVGFVLGSYYSGKNLPTDTGKIKYILFPDGTKIKYNMETSVLEVDCVGDINISSGAAVNIKGNEVNIDANSFNVTANESNFDHKINCADVIADKGSYNDHIDNLH